MWLPIQRLTLELNLHFYVPTIAYHSIGVRYDNLSLLKLECVALNLVYLWHVHERLKLLSVCVLYLLLQAVILHPFLHEILNVSC